MELISQSNSTPGIGAATPIPSSDSTELGGSDIKISRFLLPYEKEKKLKKWWELDVTSCLLIKKEGGKFEIKIQVEYLQFH